MSDQIRLLERKLHQADNRIADLESAARRRETYENERQARLVEATQTIIALRLELQETNARILAHHLMSNDASQTAATACARLVLWEPIVLAAKQLWAAMQSDDRIAGDAACAKLAQALEALEKVPNA